MAKMPMMATARIGKLELEECRGAPPKIEFGGLLIGDRDSCDCWIWIWYLRLTRSIEEEGGVNEEA